MKITAIVEALVAAGATPEMILAAVRSAEEQKDSAADASKEKGRERWRRWDERRRSNVSQRVQTLANGSKQLMREGTRGEDKTSTQKIEPQEVEQKDTRGSRDVREFRAELAELDAERLDALIKHRRTKRGTNTGHAAKLFRRDAEACGMSLVEAVDTCISRNWITVRPEYFGNRQRAGPAPPRTNPTLVAAQQLMEKLNAVSPSEIEGNHPAPRLVAIGRGGG